MRPVDVRTNLKNHTEGVFRNYEMCEAERLVCIEALGYRIPMPFETVTDSDGNEVRICKACGGIVEADGWKADFCPECGQAVKWDGNRRRNEHEKRIQGNDEG